MNTTLNLENAEKTERPKCAHDPGPYLHLMDVFQGKGPIYIAPSCPYFAMDGSAYCVPHSIFHNTIPEAKRAVVQANIGKAVQWFANGWLIAPPTPDGRPTLPGWWPDRLN